MKEREYLNPVSLATQHQGNLCSLIFSRASIDVFTWRHSSHFGVLKKVKTAAILVSRTNPVGVKLFFYVNTFFCCDKSVWLLPTWKETHNNWNNACLVYSDFIILCWAPLGLSQHPVSSCKYNTNGSKESSYFHQANITFKSASISCVTHVPPLNLRSTNTVVLHFGNWSESLAKLVLDERSFVIFHKYRPGLVNLTPRAPTSLNTNLISVSNGCILFISIWVIQFSVLVRLCLLSHAYLDNPDIANLWLFSK